MHSTQRAQRGAHRQLRRRLGGQGERRPGASVEEAHEEDTVAVLRHAVVSGVERQPAVVVAQGGEARRDGATVGVEARREQCSSRRAAREACLAGLARRYVTRPRLVRSVRP